VAEVLGFHNVRGGDLQVQEVEEGADAELQAVYRTNTVWLKMSQYSKMWS